MNRYWSYFLILAIALSSCTAQRGMQGRPNPGAIAAGAAVGGTVGSIIGGNVGYNNNGWWGGNRGSAIGSIVGTIAGAAIGGAVSSAEQRKREEAYRQQQQQSQPVYQTNNNIPAQNSNSPLNNLKITNIRFIDEGRTQKVNANESSKLLFDVVNEGNTTIYDVVPVVEEITNNKQISISPSQLIEAIEPGEGVRYTADIYAGNKLKTGNITIRIQLTDEEGQQGDWKEFDLPTQN